MAETETKQVVITDSNHVHPLHVVAFVESVLIFLVMGFFIGKKIYYKEETPQPTIAYLTEEIKNIGELSTLQYDYDTFIKLTSENARWFGIQIPKTEDIVAITISGTIKFGVKLYDDSGNLRVKIEKDQDKIIVKIPKAEILSHELDYSSAKVESLKESTLNNFQQSFKDAIVMTTTGFEQAKKEQEDNDKNPKIKKFKEQAEANAEKVFRNLFEPLLKTEDKDVVVDFVFF